MRKNICTLFVGVLLVCLSVINSTTKNVVNMELVNSINELCYTNVSKEALKEMYSYESYEDEEIEIALKHSKIDFNTTCKLALIIATCEGLKSEEEARDYLKTLGFTDKEIKYTIKHTDISYINIVVANCFKLNPDKSKTYVQLENLLKERGFKDEEIISGIDFYKNNLIENKELKDIISNTSNKELIRIRQQTCFNLVLDDLDSEERQYILNVEDDIIYDTSIK